ncbi:MAG TPA: ABC transporter permease [Saprospiraceae bacterium]|nr:ABC transporter permease [Lewinellaceae bacterium]HRX29615.1 ABC transporter permease [Saprospiraceae bacterium]
MDVKEGFSEFLKNKILTVSILMISVFLMLSIFAYLLVFDNTPNANNQFSEIALKDPGFNSKFIIIPNKSKVNTGYFEGMVTGFPSQCEYIFYKNANQKASDLILQLHNGREKILSSTQYDDLSNKHLVGEHTFLLGTDKYGRDIFSRVILGIRVSIFVGLLAVLVSLSIGITLGLMGGYFGKWIDGFVQYFINVTWAIPTLLLVFAIVLLFGRGLGVIFFAVGLTMWVDVARIVRGETLRIKEENYVQSAISLGYKWPNIVFKQILPNLIGPILVIAAANFATAILVEAGLSFLGFGIKPPAPSLGNILNEHYAYAMTGRYSLAMVPAIVIMLLVLSFNLLGSGLRDYFDVKK